MQHGREDRLAVAVVVEVVQFRVEEDGETVHLEETLREEPGGKETCLSWIMSVAVK